MCVGKMKESKLHRIVCEPMKLIKKTKNTMCLFLLAVTIPTWESKDFYPDFGIRFLKLHDNLKHIRNVTDLKYIKLHSHCTWTTNEY